ncbi:MAG: PPC domain-containing DNA-binding protein, partial [Chloroflexota bacterium]
AREVEVVAKELEGLEPRFQEKVDLSDVLFTRLRPGEDLFGRVKEICEENDLQRGVILASIGSLTDVAFVNPKPGASMPFDPSTMLNLTELKGPFELLTLEGTVFPLVGEFGDLKDGDPVLHLHGVLSSEEGKVTAGHLRKATVFTTVELFLARIKGSKAVKKKSVVSALTELRADL